MFFCAMKSRNMAKALLIALLSVSRLSLVHGWAKEMVTDEGCAKESTEGSVLMNDYAVIDNDAYVTVERDGVEIESGSTYTSGESLTVSFSTSNQFIIETKSATFADGYCENTRVMDSDSEVVMPSDGSTVYLWAASAGGYNAVTVTNLFTLTASVDSGTDESETEDIYVTVDEVEVDESEEDELSGDVVDEDEQDEVADEEEGVDEDEVEGADEDEVEDVDEDEVEGGDEDEVEDGDEDEVEGGDEEEVEVVELEDTVDEENEEQVETTLGPTEAVVYSQFPTDSSPTHHPTDRAPTRFPTETEEATVEETLNEISDFVPTQYPTEGVPTHFPTAAIMDMDETIAVTIDPSAYPSEIPVYDPTAYPTEGPVSTEFPTEYPTDAAPTHYPSEGSNPTLYPTEVPTEVPSISPTQTVVSTAFPTDQAPTHYPSPEPVTTDPTASPSVGTTVDPTSDPTEAPTLSPSDSPVEYDDDDSTDSVSSSTLDTPPNFIVIIADDLGYSSLGYNDASKEFLTPRLTEMANSGIIMNNFYAQEVCTPSRASLFTGRYPLSMGMQYGMVQASNSWGLTLGETLIAEVLQEEGYSTHILGKWHLGYFSPLLLPTARGFDTFLGYLNGENYYWSKRNPDYPEFHDFAASDTECFKAYNGTDKLDYSTKIYTNHALDIIEEHDQSDPLFLVLSYQAVHDPFVDMGHHRNGMPDSYLPTDILEQIHSSIVGTIPQEYHKSLYLMDEGVGQVKDKLEEVGMLDNTYIIFMSDNGGCMYGGGKNYPLRGTKGSLFEGGTKVESFIYSPMLKRRLQGTKYDGLMHISDWFPTMLALANINYSVDEDYALDGVNQTLGWLGKATPRTTMLYNMQIDKFNWWYNGSMAVRNERYKILHTYDDDTFGTWYDNGIEFDFDVNITNPDENRCNQESLSGNFTYFLFDLWSDPYEQNNLYDTTDEELIAIKESLYDLTPGYEAKAETKVPTKSNRKVKKIWEEKFDWYMLPFIDSTNDNGNWVMKIKNKFGIESYPEYCPNEDFEGDWAP